MSYYQIILQLDKNKKLYFTYPFEQKRTHHGLESNRACRPLVMISDELLESNIWWPNYLNYRIRYQSSSDRDIGHLAPKLLSTNTLYSIPYLSLYLLLSKSNIGISNLNHYATLFKQLGTWKIYITFALLIINVGFHLMIWCGSI